jgi:hypothetical protein
MLLPPDLKKLRNPGFFLLLALLVLPGLIGLSGCGYGFSGGQSTVLERGEMTRREGQPDSIPTLAIKNIEHHTLFPWFAQVIRTSLRDEIGARTIAVWADSGNVDYEMQIVVHSFTLRTALQRADDTSLLYSANILMTGIIYNSEGVEIWRSSRISYSDTYDAYNERSAAEQLAVQAVKLLVAEMRNTF